MKLLPTKRQGGIDPDESDGDGKVPGWLNRVASALGTRSARARTLIEDHFEIEGVMR